MKVDIPLGDVVDRATICRLKTQRIDDPVRLAHARTELASLTRAWTDESLPPMQALPSYPRLAAVNAELWEVEDALRACEREQDFGEAFVALARRVYRLNDERAALKATINKQLGSALVEVKSYADY